MHHAYALQIKLLLGAPASLLTRLELDVLALHPSLQLVASVLTNQQMLNALALHKVIHMLIANAN